MSEDNQMIRGSVVQKGIQLQVRPQSTAEESANRLRHGIGLLLALAFTPVLIVTTARQGNAANLVGVSAFAFTMVMLYLSSTLYHGLPRGGAKRLREKCDHSAIYLFIAGSDASVALGALHGAWGGRFSA